MKRLCYSSWVESNNITDREENGKTVPLVVINGELYLLQYGKKVKEFQGNGSNGEQARQQWAILIRNR